MGNVKIVTDSTADLPESLVEEFKISVVPLKVIFGNEIFREGIDIKNEEFYHKLTSCQQLPTTSQPSPGEFKQVYEELTNDGSSVISIHISSLLSGTYQSALMAQKELHTRDITVIDSKKVSMGLGMAVLEAAQAAKAGKTAAEIVSLVEQLIPKIHIYFVVNTMEYLQKGGRIGKASALLGTMLNIKPVLMIEDGLVVPMQKIRGKGKAVDRLAEMLKDFAGRHGPLRCALMHADALDETMRFHQRLISQITPCEFIIANIGVVVGTHGGPGLIGVVFYEK